MRVSSLFLAALRYIVAKTPERAVVIPAIVGKVAFETPPAIDLASPPPVKAITWNTSIMPVTVPNRPSKGQSATQVAMTFMLPLISSRLSESSRSRIFLAFQDLRSLRPSHAVTTAARSAFHTEVKYQMRSKISVHMKNTSVAISQSTFPPFSMKARMTSITPISSYPPEQSVVRALGMIGDDTCRLLIQNMNDALRAAIDHRVQ